MLIHIKLISQALKNRTSDWNKLSIKEKDDLFFLDQKFKK